MGSLWRDIRLALRTLARQPGFAAVVVLTLALGIGANTAIFSFVNALLLRPFPFRDPDQLVQIHSVRGGQPGMISGRELLDFREHLTSVEAAAGHTATAGGYNYSGEGRPEEWVAILTTGNLFEVLGVPLLVGAKWEEPVDRQRDFHVILTHGVWQRAFGGRRDVVGSKIILDHAAGYSVDGVAGRHFDYPRGVEVYRSIGGFTTYDRRVRRNLVGVARIRRPHTIRQLQSELDGLSRRLAEEFPDTNAGVTFRAVSFREVYSGDVRPYLLVLLGAVGFVLLIACANAVNLLLARGLARTREMAVRMALGAGRGELLQQTLAESAALALTAGALGAGLSYWWVKLLRVIVGAELPQWLAVEMDGRVLLFTLAASLSAALLSGLAPALQLSRPALLEGLKDGTRGASAGCGTGRVRDAMVVAAIALAVVLVTGAGLLIRGLHGLMSQDKGFRSDSIATFRVALGWKRYINQELIAGYYERALRELEGIPGVEAVAFGSAPPLARLQESEPHTVQAEGQSFEDVRRNPYVNRPFISENYFLLLGIPLRAGRFFNEFDGPQSEPVVIISERLARTLWGQQDPLGRLLLYAPPATDTNRFRKVVGVVGDVQRRELGGEPGLDYYVPYRQRAESNQYLLARTRLNLGEFTRRAEQAMWSIDREQSVFNFETYDQRILDSVWQLCLSRTLLTLFSSIALALAAVGAYGLLSYLVGQRRREIGIRVALGANPWSIRWLVVKRAAWLSLAGLALGLTGAVALGRLLERALPQIQGLHWPTFAVSGSVLLGVALAAALLPAWRASAVDPLAAVREE